MTPEQTVQAYLQALDDEDVITMENLEEVRHDGETRATTIAITDERNIIISDLEVTLVNQGHSTASVSASYHFEDWTGDQRTTSSDMSEVYTLTNSSGKWLISSRENL